MANVAEGSKALTIRETVGGMGIHTVRENQGTRADQSARIAKNAT
jgi:hypothetical protein